MSLKVGDTVRIRPSSRYYGLTHTNPIGISGIIESIEEHEDHLPISVLWDNGQENAYYEHDLEPVEELVYEI